MNLPNKLTVMRIALTFVMTVFLTVTVPFGKTLALAVFVAASVTDYWDGRLARRHNRITAFGQFMDPLADKILVSAAFVSFVAIGRIVPAWVVIIIISREFLVTGLRLLASNEGKLLPAGPLGKHKTIWQIVGIIVIMVGLAVQEDVLPRVAAAAVWRDAFARYFHVAAYAVSMLIAVLTVLSGVAYLWQNRALIRGDI